MSEEDKNKVVIKLKKQDDGLYHCQINGQEYAFRKWTWGEKNKLYGDCSKFDLNGQPKFDSAEFNLQMLLSTIKIASFPITREAVLNHPDSVLIDALQEITTKLNLLGRIEIQNL